MAFPLPMEDVSEAETERMVSNITAVWDRATADQRERGRQWYRVAHDLANVMADGDVRKGAGVIAALSPQARWGYNVRQAQAMLAGDVVGNTRERLSKAERIMHGEDPFHVLTGPKTRNFYYAIAHPDDVEAVVIDRHAHDIALNHRYGNLDRGLHYGPRYKTFADAYRLAAQRLGVSPSVLQATTWVVWTEESG